MTELAAAHPRIGPARALAQRAHLPVWQGPHPGALGAVGVAGPRLGGRILGREPAIVDLAFLHGGGTPGRRGGFGMTAGGWSAIAPAT